MLAGLSQVAVVKIGFVLASPRASPLASTRISVLQMLPYLAQAGHDAVIVFEPEATTPRPALGGLAERLIAERFDVVYFQKVAGPDVLAMVRRLRNAGIRTIFGVCDLIDNEMAEACDATITVTEFLRGLYRADLRSRIHVVHDGIENEAARKLPDASAADGDPTRLTAVLISGQHVRRLPAIGRIPGFLRVLVVGDYPPSSSWITRLKTEYWDWRRNPSLGLARDSARFVLWRNFETRRWSIDAAYSAMQTASIGIIPIDTNQAGNADGSEPLWRVKSENRLTLKMAMGLPVIATPIPAYRAVLRHGETGFFAETPAQWRACFAALRDPELCRKMGAAARAAVIERFSKAEQARRLLGVLDAVSPGRRDMHG